MQSLGPSFNRAAARLADRIHRPPVRGVGDAAEVLSSEGTGGAALPTALPLAGSRGIKLVGILAAVLLPFGIYAFASSGQESAGEESRAAAPGAGGAGGGEGSREPGSGETGMALPERSPSPEPSESVPETEQSPGREELDREASRKVTARPGTSSARGGRASGLKREPARSASPPVAPAVAPAALAPPAAAGPPAPQAQSVACVVASTFALHGGEVTERGELLCSDGTRMALEPAQIRPAAAPPKAHCEDGVDNDSDGLVDRQDPACETLGDSSEVDPTPRAPEPQCSDGKDNDGDGAVDGYDSGCVDPAGESEVDPASPEEPVCGDEVDNDGDGYVDLVDPGCLAADDVDEMPDNAVPACKDGLDNDADGLVDLDDPGCASGQDLSELEAG
jgi:hypothetical protein